MLQHSTNNVVSRITVVTMKKKSNINTISGRDAVDIAGIPFFPSFSEFTHYESPPMFLGSASDIF